MKILVLNIKIILGPATITLNHFTYMYIQLLKLKVISDALYALEYHDVFFQQ